jgi:oligopeptidase B
VWRHVIGTDPDADKLVFHEEDEAFYVGIGVSRSEKIIYIHSGSAVTSDIRMLPADDPMGEWRLVLPRKNDVEYSVDDRGDQLFITVRDASRPNSELLVAPLQDPLDASPLLPHRVDVKLEGVALSRDYLVAFERENGLQQAVVHRLPADGASVATSPLTGGQPIAFDEPAYELSPGSQGDFDSPLLRFHYTSLTTPDTVYDFHCATGQRAIKKMQPVLGGFDKTKYRTVCLSMYRCISTFF